MYLLLLFMLFTVFDFLAITDMVNVRNISQHAVPSSHKSITYICHVCERSLSLRHCELHEFDLRECTFYRIISNFALNWEIYHSKILTFIIVVQLIHTLTVIQVLRWSVMPG